MYLNQIIPENIDWSISVRPESKVEIVNQLIDQHTFVSDKLLPEIDLHFWALINNNTTLDISLIHGIYQIFVNYKEQLEDHFYFEERLVFPAFLKNTKPIDEATMSFIQKHEDFEALLGEMIQEIQEKLAPLRVLMSLRVLELKLERLTQIMEEHQVLEDYLFAQE
jgi:iron-sulfur cluster repair protein YtfE (RIC family)